MVEILRESLIPGMQQLVENLVGRAVQFSASVSLFC